MSNANPGNWNWGTGRRKTAVARVRIREGSGQFVVNDRPAREFFTEERDLVDIHSPLELTETLGHLDVFVNVRGGGFTGQAGAVKMGLARALSTFNPQFDKALREHGFMTRDSRMKERKKYGRRGARRSFQFSKR